MLKHTAFRRTLAFECWLSTQWKLQLVTRCESHTPYTDPRLPPPLPNILTLPNWHSWPAHTQDWGALPQHCCWTKPKQAGRESAPGQELGGGTGGSGPGPGGLPGTGGWVGMGPGPGPAGNHTAVVSAARAAAVTVAHAAAVRAARAAAACVARASTARPLARRCPAMFKPQPHNPPKTHPQPKPSLPPLPPDAHLPRIGQKQRRTPQRWREPAGEGTGGRQQRQFG